MCVCLCVCVCVCLFVLFLLVLGAHVASVSPGESVLVDCIVCVVCVCWW